MEYNRSWFSKQIYLLEDFYQERVNWQSLSPMNLGKLWDMEKSCVAILYF